MPFAAQQTNNEVSYTPPGPQAEAFLASEDYVIGLLGPVGSGKSSAACWKMVLTALKQKPFNGVRSTRWVVVRNTYPELKSTTIKTWQDWFPESVAPMKWDAPISSRLRIDDIGDGTALDMEVLFMAMDRPEDVGKLRSLEVTGAWINEASEIDKAVLDMLTQRCGRFPAARRGGPSWSGVILDTNPPDDDHWWYVLAEKDTSTEFGAEMWAMTDKVEKKMREEGLLRGDQQLFRFFRQPGALYLDNGEYKPNPDAENIQNIHGGYAYYYKQLAGKAESWIKVFILAEYGSTLSGKPVFPEWNEKYHLAKEPLKAVLGLPIILGWDFGLTPACVALQITAKGQVLVLREWVAENMGIRQFATEIVRPALINEFSKFKFESVGDPAGTQRAQTDEKTCMQELMECGIPTEPASSNDFTARREAVAFWLLRNVAGDPGFVVDPSCKTIRKGMNGGYHYGYVNSGGSRRTKDRPEKNRFSHPLDALQYGCLRLRAGLNPVRVLPSTKQRSSRGWT
jgi:hypothetical protein